MKALLLPVSSLLLVASSSLAQTLPPVPPDLPPPELTIEQPGKKPEPLGLKACEVTVKVRGHLATTSYDMTFYNPHDRVLEGELNFPLGEGQTVSGYALEINGQLRQGVVVEKQKAREVFEDVVRQRVDPGLAEVTKGNAFRTRVYPLPAKGTKRVVLSFEQELPGGAEGMRYHQSLAFGKRKMERFKVSVELVQQTQPPILRGKVLDGLSFTQQQANYTARLEQQDYLPEAPLSFLLPHSADAQQSFMVTSDLEPTQGYFSTRVLPTRPWKQPQPRAIESVALYFDASGSALKRDNKAEQAFLAAWFKRLGNVQVELHLFRNDVDPPSLHQVKDGNWDSLAAALKEAPLDGGTSLGSLDMTQTKADIILLISDGLTNIGSAEPKLPQSTPVWCAHAASFYDAATLERIARSTGGRSLNLATLGTDAAAAAMGQAPFQFLRAKVISGQATDTYPSLATPVDSAFHFAGKFQGKTELELQFGHGSEVTATQRITLDPKAALAEEAGAFVRRVWAQKKIAELRLDEKRHSAAITELGKTYSIVTPGTSLLVLDNVADYVRYKIMPPEPAMRKQYEALIAEKNRRDQNANPRKDMQVVGRFWKDFKDWHGKRHPWLETVLHPATEREHQLLQRLKQDKKYAEKASAWQTQLAEMRSAAEGLQKNWREAAQDQDSRASWEKEAIALMLNLDDIRQQRLKQWPETEPAEGPSIQSPVPRLASVPASPSASEVRSSTAAAAADPFAAAPMSPAAPAPAERDLRTTLGGRNMGSGGFGGAGAGGGFGTGIGTGSRTDSESGSTVSGSFSFKPWDPKSPYLTKMQASKDPYAAYLKERSAHADSSAFFLDSADFFRNTVKDQRLALRVLTNLAEMNLESAPLLRVLAYRLQQWEKHELAVPLFETVVQLRGEEPQSYRDLALALSQQPQPNWKRAAEMYWAVISRTWSERFNGVEQIALHELNAMLKRVPEDCPKDQRPDPSKLGLTTDLYVNVPVDLRVTLSWDADNTDMDLWVIDPLGEVCIYNHNRTQTGGHMTHDFTQGYGPEVFTIRRALPGTYQVKVNYFGDRQQQLHGPTTVQVQFQTHYGSPTTKTEAVTLRLSENKQILPVGTFVFKPQ